MRYPTVAPLDGVLAAPDHVADAFPVIDTSPSLLPGTAQVRGWETYACPSDDQGHQQSCVGHAWAGWLECMIRRYVADDAMPRGGQLDAKRIWSRGRELFWGGSMSAGLYVPQGLQAMIDLGMVPPDTLAMRVTEDAMAMATVLQNTPIVWAHLVGAAWYSPDPQNGCIESDPVPDGSMGAHCTLYLERLSQRQAGINLFFCNFANSWGEGWGWHGLGMLWEPAAIRTALPNSMWTARLPDGWEKWRGWEKFIVPCAKG